MEPITIHWQPITTVKFDDLNKERITSQPFEIPSEWNGGLVARGTCLPKQKGESVVLYAALVPVGCDPLGAGHLSVLVLPAESIQFQMPLNRINFVGGDAVNLVLRRDGMNPEDTARGDWTLTKLEIVPEGGVIIIKFGVGKDGIEEEYGTVISFDGYPPRRSTETTGPHAGRVDVTLHPTPLGLQRLTEVDLCETPPVFRTFWIAEGAGRWSFQGLLVAREITPEVLKVSFVSEIGTSGADDITGLPAMQVAPRWKTS